MTIENSVTVVFKHLDDMTMSGVRDLLRDLIRYEDADQYARGLQEQLTAAHKERAEAQDMAHKLTERLRYLRGLIEEIVRDRRLMGEFKPEALTKLSEIDALIKKRDEDEIPF